MKNHIFPALVKIALVLLFCFLSIICSYVPVFAQQPPITSLTQPPVNLPQNPQNMVPQLVGREYNPDYISALLDRYGLQFGEGFAIPNNDSIGLITFQSVPPGTRGNPDVPINVNYATEVPIFEVPDFRRIHFEEAIQRIERGSFSVGNVEGVSSDSPAEIVVRQSPEPGTMHEIATRIDLFYSLGSMPSLIGLTPEQAENRILPLDLRLEINREVISLEPSGTIIGQEPNAGEPLPRNRIVNVTIAIPKPVTNRGKNSLPPWIFWIGGIVAAAVLGVYLGKQAGRKNKKPLAQKELDLDLKTVLDSGIQKIESADYSLFENHLHLKYIIDQGKQTIKNN